MEFEYVRVRPERLQTESGVDPWFGSAGYEELDKWDIVHITGEHGQERGGRLLVSTLIKSINNNEGRSVCCLERANNEFLHL